MTTFSLPAPRLAGIVSALPAHSEANADLADRFGAEAIAKIIAATGIERRPIAKTETVGELGTQAARRLLERLDWAPETIDLVVVVTQTPDYPMPATACLLQNALGLAKHAAAFDLSLGCSGFVYGLSIVGSLLATGAARRALLVTGDITSRLIGADDRSLAPLFGDAVSVTALEAGGIGNISFDLGTDGSGAPYLTCHAGGTVEPGPARLFMDGTQVMAFSLKQVRPSIQRVMAEAGKAMAEIDHVVLHQANAMMLKTLGQKLGATPEQLVIALREYGNTSSASIPLALTECLGGGGAGVKRLVLSGFGVGWSWASACWETAVPGVCAVVRAEFSVVAE